jgi:TonB family protein
VLDITYGNRGQPRNVQIRGGSASTECRQAAAGLALLEISPVGEARPDERTDHVVAVFSRDAVDCEGLAARRQPTRSVVAEGITEPRKIRDVKPVYPPDAVAARLQGKVFVEATIDRSGCVGNMWVIEPAHPMLMVEALVAVRQWRFTPTLLNGEAVPVRMTVTVNFTLN